MVSDGETAAKVRARAVSPYIGVFWRDVRERKRRWTER